MGAWWIAVLGAVPVIGAVVVSYVLERPMARRMRLLSVGVPRAGRIKRAERGVATISRGANRYLQADLVVEVFSPDGDAYETQAKVFLNEVQLGWLAASPLVQLRVDAHDPSFVAVEAFGVDPALRESVPREVMEALAGRGEQDVVPVQRPSRGPYLTTAMVAAAGVVVLPVLVGVSMVIEGQKQPSPTCDVVRSCCEELRASGQRGVRGSVERLCGKVSADESTEVHCQNVLRWMQNQARVEQWTCPR